MSNLIRQTHRWLSICFTAGVILNTVVIFGGLAGRQPPFWLYLFALVPLFLLLFSGLHLFALPYWVRWSRAATAEVRP
ncbi:MAG TPA: hypothetical protein VGF50_00045 [Caulobacteraceae bacterium]